MKSNIFNLKVVSCILFLGMIAFNGCREDEEIFEKTRLFRPVLSQDLFSIGNTIVVNMGKMKEAVSYTLEVSRDTFNTIEYLIEIDTNYVVVNRQLIGEQLFWNTLYQLRVTAKAENEVYNSRPADLGSVRTQRFPTILNIPASDDVIDVAARVTWIQAGALVTGAKVYSASDLQLNKPLLDQQFVSPEENSKGEVIVTGLEPATAYQIAIYSGEDLRGWVNYTTLVEDIDPAAPGVIDVRQNESATAITDAVSMAPDGSVILVKKGMVYDLPRTGLNKSITIRGAYGFGRQKAKLMAAGGWDILENSAIDHIRFIDVEIRGGNYSAHYVFNPQRSNVSVREIVFENCDLGTLRGIMRIRGNIEIDNFEIRNTLVDSIGGYGILTTDTNPNSSKPTARVNNILLQNSTFNKIQAGITSRNNSTSILIEGCTFANFLSGSNFIFRYRGGNENNNVTSGVIIRNSIFGHGWDESKTENYAIRGMEGFVNTTLDIVNTYSTKEFSFSNSEIPGFPIGNYNGGQSTLWQNPAQNNFNFKDLGFVGRFGTGDPRWRVKI